MLKWDSLPRKHAQVIKFLIALCASDNHTMKPHNHLPLVAIHFFGG